MSIQPLIPYSTTLLVRDTCLCLHAQRAARALARRFDTALKALGLTNGQFSLMMSLNRPEPPPMGPVAQLLAMDRRRFDTALKALGLTNGQFSLMMSLNRPEPPPMGPVAQLLAMDRTTLTAALKALGLTNGQFSLMMSLNRPEPPPMGPVAQLLAMDRTTLTAALKPLQRRGWVSIETDPKDRRGKRLRLTADGAAVLSAAVPIWRDTHAAIEAELSSGDADGLRRDLLEIAR